MKEQVVQAQLAISERDKKNKKLQQVILEMRSQDLTPPMDDEIINLFSQLNYDILRIVKKHFTQSMNIKVTALESAPWKEYRPLSRENRQLWIQAFIADDLYEQFFSGKRRIFGFNAEQEQVLQDIESTLTKSGKGQSSIPQSTRSV